MSDQRFRDAEDEYLRLRGKLATGHITRAQFDAAVRQLMLQDGQGRYWTIAPESGRWLFYDGKMWVQAQPPDLAPSPHLPRPSDLPERASPGPAHSLPPVHAGRTKLAIAIVGGVLAVFFLALMYLARQGTVALGEVAPRVAVAIPPPTPVATPGPSSEDSSVPTSAAFPAEPTSVPLLVSPIPMQGAPSAPPPALSATFTPIRSSPTPTPPSGFLYDDFSDPTSGWPTFGDQAKGEVGYRDGSLRIAFYQPAEGFHSAWSQEQYADFAVEAAFSVPQGNPQAGAGLSLRALGKAWYLLWIYPESGEYIFSKDINGDYVELVKRTYSSDIQPTRKDNRLHLQLKVQACGNALVIWVAGQGGEYQYLNTVYDSALQKGHLGPSAESPRAAFSAPFEVLFDWIRVSPQEQPCAIAVSPAQPPTACVNDSVFVEHVTIPDGTNLAAGQTFKKIWRARNRGTCAWGPGYELVFVSGEAMTTATSIAVPYTAPDSAADLVVPMTAPATPGTHTGQWRLHHTETGLFGATMNVTINVLDAQPQPPSQSQPPACTASINFRADQTNLILGQKTTLRWDVECVREVYLDGQGVSGHGTREVAPRAATAYTLRAVKNDGNTEERQVTVFVLATVSRTPTPARTITRTPTPTQIPTPTRTPTSRDSDGDTIPDSIEDWVARTFVPFFIFDEQEKAEEVRFVYQVTPVLVNGQERVLFILVALYDINWIELKEPDYDYIWHWGDSESIRIYLSWRQGLLQSHYEGEYTIEQFTIRRHLGELNYQWYEFEYYPETEPARPSECGTCLPNYDGSPILWTRPTADPKSRHPIVWVAEGTHGMYLSKKHCENSYFFEIGKDPIKTGLKEDCGEGREYLPHLTPELNVGERDVGTKTHPLFYTTDERAELRVFKGERIWDNMYNFCGGYDLGSRRSEERWFEYLTLTTQYAPYCAGAVGKKWFPWSGSDAP